MLCHEADIFKNLLADATHVPLAEPQELVILADRLQINIFEAIFHGEWHVNLSINNATL